ncbi:hypothetical protein G3I76_56765, partial [Streptomyces sp. SID11233]|nr:hypothetical protein [Streptomyces sp. SID11233]
MGEAMTAGASDTPLILRRLEDAAERGTAEEAREAASGIGKLLDEALAAVRGHALSDRRCWEYDPGHVADGLPPRDVHEAERLAD